MVAEGAFVVRGDGVGMGIVEGDEMKCAAEVTETGEYAATLPDDPESFLEGCGVGP